MTTYRVIDSAGRVLEGEASPELVALLPHPGTMGWAELVGGAWVPSAVGRVADIPRGARLVALELIQRPRRAGGRPVTIADPRKIAITIDGAGYAIVEARAARDSIPWAEALRRIVREAGATTS